MEEEKGNEDEKETKQTSCSESTSATDQTVSTLGAKTEGELGLTECRENNPVQSSKNREDEEMGLEENSLVNKKSNFSIIKENNGSQNTKLADKSLSGTLSSLPSLPVNRSLVQAYIPDQGIKNPNKRKSNYKEKQHPPLNKQSSNRARKTTKDKDFSPEDSMEFLSLTQIHRQQYEYQEKIISLESQFQSLLRDVTGEYRKELSRLQSQQKVRYHNIRSSYRNSFKSLLKNHKQEKELCLNEIESLHQQLSQWRSETNEKNILVGVKEEPSLIEQERDSQNAQNLSLQLDDNKDCPCFKKKSKRRTRKKFGKILSLCSCTRQNSDKQDPCPFLERYHSASIKLKEASQNEIALQSETTELENRIEEMRSNENHLRQQIQMLQKRDKSKSQQIIELQTQLQQPDKVIDESVIQLDQWHEKINNLLKASTDQQNKLLEEFQGLLSQPEIIKNKNQEIKRLQKLLDKYRGSWKEGGSSGHVSKKWLESQDLATSLNNLNKLLVTDDNKDETNPCQKLRATKSLQDISICEVNPLCVEKMEYEFMKDGKVAKGIPVTRKGALPSDQKVNSVGIHYSNSHQELVDNKPQIKNDTDKPLAVQCTEQSYRSVTPASEYEDFDTAAEEELNKIEEMYSLKENTEVKEAIDQVRQLDSNKEIRTEVNSHYAKEVYQVLISSDKNSSCGGHVKQTSPGAEEDTVFQEEQKDVMVKPEAQQQNPTETRNITESNIRTNCMKRLRVEQWELNNKNKKIQEENGILQAAVAKCVMLEEKALQQIKNLKNDVGHAENENKTLKAKDGHKSEELKELKKINQELLKLRDEIMAKMKVSYAENYIDNLWYDVIEGRFSVLRHAQICNEKDAKKQNSTKGTGDKSKQNVSKDSKQNEYLKKKVDELEQTAIELESLATSLRKSDNNSEAKSDMLYLKNIDKSTNSQGDAIRMLRSKIEEHVALNNRLINENVALKDKFKESQLLRQKYIFQVQELMNELVKVGDINITLRNQLNKNETESQAMRSMNQRLLKITEDLLTKVAIFSPKNGNKANAKQNVRKKNQRQGMIKEVMEIEEGSMKILRFLNNEMDGNKTLNGSENKEPIQESKYQMCDSDAVGQDDHQYDKIHTAANFDIDTANDSCTTQAQPRVYSVFPTRQSFSRKPVLRGITPDSTKTCSQVSDSVSKGTSERHKNILSPRRMANNLNPFTPLSPIKKKAEHKPEQRGNSPKSTVTNNEEILKVKGSNTFSTYNVLKPIPKSERNIQSTQCMEDKLVDRSGKLQPNSNFSSSQQNSVSTHFSVELDDKTLTCPRGMVIQSETNDELEQIPIDHYEQVDSENSEEKSKCKVEHQSNSSFSSLCGSGLFKPNLLLERSPSLPDSVHERSMGELPSPKPKRSTANPNANQRKNLPFLLPKIDKKRSTGIGKQDQSTEATTTIENATNGSTVLPNSAEKVQDTVVKVHRWLNDNDETCTDAGKVCEELKKEISTEDQADPDSDVEVEKNIN